jgi:hypothetical protein
LHAQRGERERERERERAVSTLAGNVTVLIRELFGML